MTYNHGAASACVLLLLTARLKSVKQEAESWSGIVRSLLLRSPSCRAKRPHESTISCCLRPHRVRQVEASLIPVTCLTHLCQSLCSGSPCVGVPRVLPQLVWVVTHAMSSKSGRCGNSGNSSKTCLSRRQQLTSRYNCAFKS